MLLPTFATTIVVMQKKSVKKKSNVINCNNSGIKQNKIQFPHNSKNKYINK